MCTCLQIQAQIERLDRNYRQARDALSRHVISTMASEAVIEMFNQIQQFSNRTDPDTLAIIHYILYSDEMRYILSRTDPHTINIIHKILMTICL